MNQPTIIPLVEKYRPSDFNDIVLDDMSKTILTNIISGQVFPNLLFYGPPGTGKTTTAMNVVKQYQRNHGSSNNSVIHLNASDDRGIEVMRTQIYNFASSTALFETGLKIVILDEADYMTKPAQVALKYIIHKYSTNLRICIMCNYISKIDDGLLSEFVIFRFNNLPEDRIAELLRSIVMSEQISISNEDLAYIQTLYKSDIRSMINCIQTYQHSTRPIPIITPALMSSIYTMFHNKHPIPEIINAILSTDYDPKCVIKYLMNDIIQTHSHVITSELLTIMSNIVHFPDCPLSCLVGYAVSQLYDKI
jgi:replication factor C subunit 3/5